MFSDPRSPTLSSNLYQFDDESKLPGFEDDLKKPLSLHGGGGNVSMPMIAVPAPAIPSKKMKELLDNKENWQYLTPEDFGSQPTAQEIFNIPEYGPDGQEKEKPTALERFNKSQSHPAASRQPGPVGSGYSPQAANTPDGGQLPNLLPPDDNGDNSALSAFQLPNSPSSFDAATAPFSRSSVSWNAGELFGLGKSQPVSKSGDLFGDAPNTLDSHLSDFKRMLQTPSWMPDSFAPAPSGGLDGPSGSLLSPPSLTAIGDSPFASPAKAQTLRSRQLPTLESGPASPQGVQDSAVAPIAVGTAPSLTSDLNQARENRFSMPQPVFSLPQRKF